MCLDAESGAAGVKGFEEDAGGKSRFTDARASDEDDGFASVHEIEFCKFQEGAFMFLEGFLEMPGVGFQSPEFPEA